MMSTLSSSDDEFFAIEKILESKKVVDPKTGNIIETYKVKWKGYGEEQSTWEPPANFGPEGQVMITEYRLNKKMKKMLRKKAKKNAPDLMAISMSEIQKEIRKTKRFEATLNKRKEKLENLNSNTDVKVKEEPCEVPLSHTPDTDENIHDWRTMVLNTDAQLVLDKVEIPKDQLPTEKKKKRRKKSTKKIPRVSTAVAENNNLFSDPICLTSATKSTKKKENQPKDITNVDSQAPKKSTKTSKRPEKEAKKRSKETSKQKDSTKKSNHIDKPKAPLVAPNEVKKTLKRKSDEAADATLKKPKLDGIKIHKKRISSVDSNPSPIRSYSEMAKSFNNSFESYTIHQAADDDEF